MHCVSCGSSRQAEFSAEINLHFGGLQNLDTPSMLQFSKVWVCLDCGFSRFSIPEAELKKLDGAEETRGSSHRRSSPSRSHSAAQG